MAKTASKPPITAVIEAAYMPSPALDATIASIRDQVDQVIVVMPPTAALPSTANGVSFRHGSGPYLRETDLGYVLVLSEGMLYPESYAATMVHYIEANQRRRVIGLSGFFFDTIPAELPGGIVTHSLEQAIEKGQFLHVLDQQVTAYHTTTLSPLFSTDKVNGPLALAIAAQEAEIPLFCPERPPFPMQSVSGYAKPLLPRDDAFFKAVNQRTWVFNEHPRRVKIFGERNTGTNFIAAMIRQNFAVEAVGYGYLGWKHRIAPSVEDIRSNPLPNTAFIAAVRNPYGWLLSMHRKPYDMPALKGLSFSEFIRSRANDAIDEANPRTYENPMVMWNQKNHSYLSFIRSIGGEVMRHVDLISKPKILFENLGTNWQLPRCHDSIRVIAKEVNSKGQHQNTKTFDPSPYLNPNYSETIRQKDLTYINRFIDQDLMREFNFKIFS